MNTQCPVTFSIKKEYEVKDFRFIDVTIDVMHTGVNRNRSCFEKETIEAALPTLANMPILGYIVHDDNGESDFKGHEHQLKRVGNDIIYEYAGSAYGVVPESCNPRWVTKDDGAGVEREYLEVDGIVWTKFDESCDIFTRDCKKNHSVELTSMDGYTDDSGIFHCTSFAFDGFCVLSTTDASIRPAMTGSSITANFSTESIASQIKERLNEYFIVKHEFSCEDDSDINTKGEYTMEIDEIVSEQAIEVEAEAAPEEAAEPEAVVEAEAEADAAEAEAEVEAAEEAEAAAAESEAEIAEQAAEPDAAEMETAPADEPVAEPAAEYTLSSRQIMDEVGLQLKEIKAKAAWSDDIMVPKYWLRDIQGEKAIVEEYDTGKFFAIPFHMDGDNAVLDADNAVRQKVVFEDWQDGAAEMPESENILLKIAAGAIEAMSEDVVKYNEIKDSYAAYVEADRVAKENEAAAKRDALFALLDTKIGDDAEYAALKENKELEFSVLETKCYAILGRKSAEFSYIPNLRAEETDEVKYVRFGVNGSQENKPALYGGIIEQYRVAHI